MYSIIDIEGNGGRYREECIIDIAIYQFDGQKITDQFSSLVNPEDEITSFVQKLTGITPNMVKTAPKFHEIAKRVIEITKGTTLVGHNIDFDYRMLRQSFKRLGYDYKIATLDTIPLAQKLIPEAETYSLGKLVKSLGIPLVQAHRAQGDARATLDLFKLLMVKDADGEILRRQFEEANARTYVNKVKELTQDLPSDKGIVYFQDGAGEVLFVDYTDDINRFAKKIFNAKSKKFVQIQELTQQVHYELAGNAILANLMMNSRGIKKKEPLPFALYHNGQKYYIEKRNLEKNRESLLKFKSYTQGLKALSFIKKESAFQEPSALINKIQISKEPKLFIITGRTLGEKAFLVMEKGHVTSYGFYEFHHQINSRNRIQQLSIALPVATLSLTNDLKLGLLKNEIEVLDYPSK